MSFKRNQPWVPVDKIELFLQLEPAFIILGLAIGSWLLWKIFLRDIPEGRRHTLQNLFKNLAFHLIFAGTLFVGYMTLQQIGTESSLAERITSYLGLGAILWGAVVFVKVCRILVFEYLYFSHMKVPFPVLLVNLFTLLLSIIIGAWIGAEIFNIRLAPLLATSAIFSLVLGLALQDTLGNLFAGVALQFDKPYGIGDWIEIQSTGQKWVGQVYEITWRATILISFTEELITVPNRVMSQAQISNFSTKYRPIIRTQVFRLPFHADIEHVKKILLQIPASIQEIRTVPSPLVLVSETTESWVGFKLVYFLNNYGDQFIIADRVYCKALSALKAAGYELSGHRVMAQWSQWSPHLPQMTQSALTDPN